MAAGDPLLPLTYRRAVHRGAACLRTSQEQDRVVRRFLKPAPAVHMSTTVGASGNRRVRSVSELGSQSGSAILQKGSGGGRLRAKGPRSGGTDLVAGRAWEETVWSSLLEALGAPGLRRVSLTCLLFQMPANAVEINKEKVNIEKST